MKKTIYTIIAVAIASVANTAMAQEAAENDTTAIKKDKSDYVQYHHNLQVHIGGGLSTLQYHAMDAKWVAGGGAKAEVMYQYKFDKNWGIGAGVGISSLQSAADYSYHYNEQGLIHPDNNREYTAIVDYSNWREQQNVVNVEIPLRGYYTLPLTDRWALETGAGLTLNIPVYNNYKCTGADYTVEGYFPSTNVTYSNLKNHGFGNYKAEDCKGKNDLRPVNLTLNLDCGASYSVRDNLSLYAGAYFGYGFINAVAAHSNQPLHDANARQYVGTLQSDRVQSAHPIEFGAKVGIHFGLAKRMKKVEPQIERITEIQKDTVVMTVREEVVKIKHDTVVVKEEVKVVENTILDEILTSAHFGTGKAEPIFSEDAEGLFTRLKEVMDEDPESVIVVSGHTDNTGSDERNRELGQQRADAFRQALMKHGIDGRRIITANYGSSRPIAPNDTPEGRAQNRRVEVKMK